MRLRWMACCGGAQFDKVVDTLGDWSRRCELLLQTLQNKAKYSVHAWNAACAQQRQLDAEMDEVRQRARREGESGEERRMDELSMRDGPMDDYRHRNKRYGAGRSRRQCRPRAALIRHRRQSPASGHGRPSPARM